MNDAKQKISDAWGGDLIHIEPNVASTDTLPVSPVDVPVADGKAAGPETSEIAILNDSMRRRGFFESISDRDPNGSKLALLVKDQYERAEQELKAIDALTEQKMRHLNEQIDQLKYKIKEYEKKIAEAEQYQEANDPVFAQFENEKQQELGRLKAAEQELVAIRIKLGDEKAGIIGQSLQQTEEQVRTALGIQKTIYDETYQQNFDKFSREKDYLARLSKCYESLYNYYDSRYKDISRHLAVLDADGISPVTTRILSTVGVTSFGAAGFFFSTFASDAGLGNRDILYFVIGGLFNAARNPASGWFKVIILVGLLALVSIVIWVCTRLLSRIKKSNVDHLVSELELGVKMTRKIKEIEYHAAIKGNNWYTFWLNLVPGLLVTGLVVIGIAETTTNADISALNNSSEGLIVGTSIAMSFAGLVYLYIIKIVEPRLLKRYGSGESVKVNWVKSNWELALIVVSFLLISIYIIAVPYDVTATDGILPVVHRTRYAILLFASICLVGGISFAYAVRSRGLIATSRYLEWIVNWLNNAIAHCASPEVPDLNNELSEEHSNVVKHVLRSFSIKAAVNETARSTYPRDERASNFASKMMAYVFGYNKDESQDTNLNHIKLITAVRKWEERCFPHITDAMRSLEFQYREQRVRWLKAEQAFSQYRQEMRSRKQLYEEEIASNENQIKNNRTQLEETMKEQLLQKKQIELEYSIRITDLLDGFHLGIWYRQNNIGPGGYS